MAKYVTKKPRYVGGKYIFASFQHPAIIDLPDGAKPAPDLVPYNGGEVQGEALIPAHNPQGMRPPPTAAQRFSQPKPDETEGKPAKGKGRNSDSSPL